MPTFAPHYIIVEKVHCPALLVHLEHSNLLQFEDVLVEVLLQLLIGIVDAKLLK